MHTIQVDNLYFSFLRKRLHVVYTARVSTVKTMDMQ